MNSICSRGVMLSTLVNRFSGYMGSLWAIYNATHVALYEHKGGPCVYPFHNLGIIQGHD